MTGVQTCALPICRYNFVEHRRLNKNHPMWHDKWNGVSSGMWDSEEWRDYLMENGLHEYADQLKISKAVALDI